MPPRNEYDVEPIPKMRRFAFDAGYLGRRRHIVHGLFEADVSKARTVIRAIEKKTGERLSFTAFVIHCLSEALELHPHLHAYRDWRNRLVIYKDININSLIEIELDGKLIPTPHIFQSTNRRPFLDLHNELRDAQRDSHKTPEFDFMRWFLLLPSFVRRWFYWVVMRVPQLFREYSSSVMVTAVGMFGTGGGWAITMPNFTLTVAVGGISKKPGVIGDEIVIRELLNITVSIDHDIVDGAPAARFVQSFRALLENAHGLSEV